MSEFNEKGFVVVRKLVPKSFLNFLAPYYQIKYKALKDFYKMETEHEYVKPLCSVYFNDPLSVCFLYDLQDEIEFQVEKELRPIYAFTRLYETGMELKKHTDRSQCEYTVTMPLSGKPWDIFIDGTPVELEPGDIVIFKGAELPHWRKPLEDEERVQILLHYVAKHGPFGKIEFDAGMVG